uniref:hypothetical protein n=1 Tax=Stenotrophomonas maltophilia TaxID=40324 RepID=UPI001A7E088D
CFLPLPTAGLLACYQSQSLGEGIVQSLELLGRQAFVQELTEIQSMPAHPGADAGSAQHAVTLAELCGASMVNSDQDRAIHHFLPPLTLIGVVRRSP